MSKHRRANIERKTKESDIVIELDLDGTGVVDVDTGVPFFDHMLTSLGSHASFDLTVQAKGDIEVEGHHTIEDTAIVLGQALGKALARRSATTARRLDAECVAVMLTSRPVAGTPTAGTAPSTTRYGAAQSTWEQYPNSRSASGRTGSASGSRAPSPHGCTGTPAGIRSTSRRCFTNCRRSSSRRARMISQARGRWPPRRWGAGRAARECE